MNPSIRAVQQFIFDHWEDTVRYPANQAADEVPLAAPFTVPTAGPAFRLLFYWDTYFTCEGLFRSGRTDLARANADNLIRLIEEIGYVPNYPLRHDLTRSQPPVASLLFRQVYERNRDLNWLRRAIGAAEREHAFWMSVRRAPLGLNTYGQHLPPADLLRFAAETRPGRIVHVPPDLAGRARLVANQCAECESGWDFTPRFDMRCMDFAPVDLNSLLFALETNLAWFCREVEPAGGAEWEARAARRLELFNRACWDEERGFYFDYDLAAGRRSEMVSAAAFFPLWCGLASAEQAGRVRLRLGELEAEWGLVACAPGARPAGQVYQWDSPNLWPPLQFAAIAGLLRYGYGADAARLAEKVVNVVARNFERTGNLWEKYNALTGGLNVSNEYEMPAMLGWTAGTFLYACEVLESASS